MNVQKLFFTFLDAGLSPKSPATVATLLALVIGLIILQTLGIKTLFMLAIAVTVMGVFEGNKLEKKEESFVIDKAPGMWLTLMISLSTAVTMSYPNAEIIGILFAFFAYRLFDIWKPSTIGWIDREVKGGLGMMMDDVLAGIAAGVLSSILLIGIEKFFSFS